MFRVAVIGVGHWGPNLVANFREDPRSEVSWVVDLDADRLEVASNRFPEIRVGTDLEEPIRDPDVDAVVIATPTTTHEAIGRAALEAGKHVLVEKPIASSAAGGRALMKLAEERDRVLMVGHVFVYNGAAVRAKEIVDSGALGRIYTITMQRTNLGPIRIDVNAAWDLAAHDLSLASYWLGAEPLTVSAVGGAWINPGIEDAVFATLRYPEGVIVHLHASWLHPTKTRDIAIVGEKRMLTFDDLEVNEPLRLYDKQVLEERSAPTFVDSYDTFRMAVHEGDVSIPKVEPSQPLRNECCHFLDCCLEGATPRSGAREGLTVVNALEAISHSLREGGREVEVEAT
jgi:predicted dehydrogenase